jgi:hypothetical protein
MTQHPPPPPPHQHEQHNSIVLDSNGAYVGGGNYNNNNNNNNNNEDSASSSSGGSTTATMYPYKTDEGLFENMTFQSGMMVLVVGAFVLQLLGFFKQNCYMGNKAKKGYLTVSEYDQINNSKQIPYSDNPSSLRNRKMKVSGDPNHPEIQNTPPQTINHETLKHLLGTGIRMTAHGVHCEPRKIWLSMDDRSVIWQSEFSKDVADGSGNTSTIPIRGSVHRIDWDSIEYIDVGKRTDALKKHAINAQDHLCFSLLTPEGSLDLQANSQLERDTLVSCIGMKLDEYSGDWRQYYSNPELSSASTPSDFSTSAYSSIAGNPYRDLTLDV